MLNLTSRIAINILLNTINIQILSFNKSQSTRITQQQINKIRIIITLHNNRLQGLEIGLE